MAVQVQISFIMSKMQEDIVDKVEYLTYEQLPFPCAGNIAQPAIEMGFASKEWFIQFQTITNLRQANRHYSSLFLNQLFPTSYRSLIAQIDNLRSNNSKQALTLVSEIFQHQKIELVQPEIIRSLVNVLLVKSVSEKTFLKNQALKSLNFLSLKWNDGAIQQLSNQTNAQNGQISELAIKILSEMIKNNKTFESNDKFLKILSQNLNGKRSVLQKKAKQILNDLKDREGEGKLELKISSSTELLEEESTTLRRQLKQKEQKTKGPANFREFLKQKKEAC